MQIDWGWMWLDTSKKTFEQKVVEGLDRFCAKFKVSPEAIAVPEGQSTTAIRGIPLFNRKENNGQMIVYIRNDYDVDR